MPASVGYAFLLANVGAVLGNLTLVWLTDTIGARRTYFLFCAVALVLAEILFTQVHTYSGLLVLDAGVRLFRDRRRRDPRRVSARAVPDAQSGNGSGFCWNFARLLTAWRRWPRGCWSRRAARIPTAAALMTLVYAVGLVVVWFGPDVR